MKKIITGSFDPITIGHIDIIKRAFLLGSDLTVVIVDTNKGLFNIEERKELIKLALNDNGLNEVKVDITTDMVIDYARNNNVDCIIRGLRNNIDFIYEKDMFEYNFNLDNQIETIYLMCNNKYNHISSSGVRELLRYKKDISNYVTSSVNEKVKEWNKSENI